ncbi:hypothetical protein DP113_25165 [Brasilonema octagenarum UFV-E1]|jgi:hypothetical protein|uniref:Uncharacterized protein n=3 Tax=Scytonemataceae TaxID=1182 RepID=A0A856MJQ0_9CYAN|nr:hypothetical protein [Brasilonema octagenarum UFV-OR1]QDL10772.1 hypothetical protein DP114_25260 [Brasilonema sennae CENA114]QDL17117.1 hypothetical protein DP113_25165 [Brasilonema octagenarum UFV-E1]
MQLKQAVTFLVVLFASFLLVVGFSTDEVNAQPTQRYREPITQPTDGPVSDDPAPSPTLQSAPVTYTATIPANDNLGSKLKVSYTVPKLSVSGNISLPNPCWGLQSVSISSISGNKAEVVYKVKEPNVGTFCSQVVKTVAINTSSKVSLSEDKLKQDGLSSLVTARRVIVQ